MKKLTKEETMKEVKEFFSKAAKDHKKADEYVRKARNLAMKINLRLPSELKRRFCKHCNSYFTSENSRIRTRDGKLICTCFKCKKYSRYVIKRNGK